MDRDVFESCFYFGSKNCIASHNFTWDNGQYLDKEIKLKFKVQRSLLESTRVGFSDSGPTLYRVYGRVKPVLRGPNSTGSNLLKHGETTYRDRIGSD